MHHVLLPYDKICSCNIKGIYRSIDIQSKLCDEKLSDANYQMQITEDLHRLTISVSHFKKSKWFFFVKIFFSN